MANNGKSLKFSPIGKHGIMAAFQDGVIHLQIAVDDKTLDAAPLSKSGKNKLVASTGGNISQNGVTLGLNVYAPPGS